MNLKSCSLIYFVQNITDNYIVTCWLVPRQINCGYSPGGITINYNTPNITHTSGHLITRQFFTVVITIIQLSSS
jgi:hypothetical protein